MGIKIKMVKVSNSAVAVDEPSDKVKVEKILNEKKDRILITGGCWLLLDQKFVRNYLAKILLFLV